VTPVIKEKGKSNGAFFTVISMTYLFKMHVIFVLAAMPRNYYFFIGDLNERKELSMNGVQKWIAICLSAVSFSFSSDSLSNHGKIDGSSACQNSKINFNLDVGYGRLLLLTNGYGRAYLADLFIGYRFDRSFSVGGCLAAEFEMNEIKAYSTPWDPILLDLRYDPVGKRVAPFASIGVGGLLYSRDFEDKRLAPCVNSSVGIKLLPDRIHGFIFKMAMQFYPVASNISIFWCVGLSLPGPSE
jgi:hypothetical protein